VFSGDSPFRLRVPPYSNHATFPVPARPIEHAVLPHQICSSTFGAGNLQVRICAGGDGLTVVPTATLLTFIARLGLVMGNRHDK
jgi:hypothetical protein